MNRRKLGNIKQCLGSFDIEFKSGAESGKNCVLVQAGKLEVLFNKDNALDISRVRYRGENISFLSKNGINSDEGEFAEHFEGGFLYTCGTDNVSSCVKGKPVHGSLHYKKAENVYSFTENEKITVGGDVRVTALFGENLVLRRRYEITENEIVVNDEIINEGYTPAKYVLLYHTNFGYPFLDENLKIDMPTIKSEGLTDYAQSRADMRLKITAPTDGGNEEVFYNYLSRGEATLYNDSLGISVKMQYDTENFPVTLLWKSMISGDYALGVEPATTRFDEFSPREIAPLSSAKYKIKITFG
mgnify:CR=1 FL=1